jgi:hypothetical protein
MEYGQQRVSFLQFVESSAPRWNRRGSLDLHGHGEVHRPVSVNEGEEVLQPAKRSGKINWAWFRHSRCHFEILP